MEEGSSEDEEEERHQPKTIKAPIMAAPPVAAPIPPISAPTPGNVTIKKYDPKAAAAIKKRVDDDQFLISPITGEKVPARQAAEHMKVGLLDPRWIEERDKQINKKSTEEVVFAPGQSIESNLKHLAERRTDIFGVGEDAALESGIGQKRGEEEGQQGKSGWDGGNAGARQGISVEEQISAIHKAGGRSGLQERTPEPERKSLPPQPPPVQKPAPPPVMVAPPVVVPVLPVRPVMMAPQPVFLPQPVVPRPMGAPPMVPMGHAGPSMAPAYIPPPPMQQVW